MEITTTDERKGLPSASSFEIYANCSGQPSLLAAIRESGYQQEAAAESSGDAQRGTRIHLALEREDPSILSDPEEQDAYETALKLEKRVVAEWAEEFDVQGSEAFREDRLWLRDTQGNELLSGKLDRLRIGHSAGEDSKPALIIDFKTGRATHAGSAVNNWQLRVQAVLAKHNFNISSARTALIKPEVANGTVDCCDYSESVLPMWEASIIHHLWMTKQPDAARHAGEWCRYCPCKAFCPEVGVIAMFPSYMEQSVQESVQDKKIRALIAVRAMTPHDIATVYQNKPVIESVLSEIAFRLKSFSPEQLSELGMKPTKGRKMDFIHDHVGARKHLCDLLGLTAEQMDGVLEINRANLLKLIGAVTGAKAKKIEAWLDKELDPYMTRKEADPGVKFL